MTRRPCQPDAWQPRATNRTRVLVEHADGAMLTAHQLVLERAGYEFAGCAGPAGRRQPCPLTTGGACPTAAEADVVIHGLSVSDADPSEVLAALRAQLPDTPVVVQVPVSSPAAAKQLPKRGRLTVSPLPITRQSVLDAVSRALRNRADRPPVFPADPLRDESLGSF